MSDRGGMMRDPKRLEIRDTLKLRLKETMTSASITSTSLSKQLGEAWNPVNIEDYISKDKIKEPLFATAALIAKVLGVSCDYLAGFTNSSNPDVDKAHVSDVLGLSALSKEALDHLSSLLSLRGHWRRNVLPYIQAQDRWCIEGTQEKAESLAFASTYGVSAPSPINNYELNPLTSALMINQLLSDNKAYSLIENILVSSLEYIELKDAYAYTEALRAAEKAEIDKESSILRGLNKNEYDPSYKGSERYSFDKLGHDNQLKVLKERQTIQKSIIHEKMDELLDYYFDKSISSLPTYKEKAANVLNEIKKWLTTVKAHDEALSSMFSDIPNDLLLIDPPDEQNDQEQIDSYSRSLEEENRVLSKLADRREGKIDG